MPIYLLLVVGHYCWFRNVRTSALTRNLNGTEERKNQAASLGIEPNAALTLVTLMVGLLHAVRACAVMTQSLEHERPWVR